MTPLWKTSVVPSWDVRSSSGLSGCLGYRSWTLAMLLNTHLGPWLLLPPPEPQPVGSALPYSCCLQAQLPGPILTCLCSCITKPKISCITLTSLSFTDPQRPNCKSSCSCQIWPPLSEKASYPISWTSYTPLVFNRMGFKSQLHPLTRSRGTSPSCYYKACLLQSLLFHLAPECSRDVVLHGRWCPPPLGKEYKGLKLLSHQSRVECHMFSHLILFRAGDPSFKHKVNRRWLENSTLHVEPRASTLRLSFFLTHYLQENVPEVSIPETPTFPTESLGK